jgi:hypothetical protein
MVDEDHFFLDIHADNYSKDFLIPLTNIDNTDYDTQNIIPINEELENTKIKSNNINITDEYLRKKCKRILLDDIFNFLNQTIKKVYNNKIGEGVRIKELKPLNYKTKSEMGIKYNKEFINKSIGEIFSNNISDKYTNFSKCHNKSLIINLLNEEDEEKKNFFNRLFNLTFLQCLEHFREDNFYVELDGLNLLNDIITNIIDEEYKTNLIYYFENYEKIINKKKERRRRRR